MTPAHIGWWLLGVGVFGGVAMIFFVTFAWLVPLLWREVVQTIEDVREARARRRQAERRVVRFMRRVH